MSYEPILFSRWICSHSFKNYYTLESLQDKKHCKCLPYTVPLLGTQNITIHNIGSLNIEPQFNFSSVRLKFKTGTSINLISMVGTMHNHNQVVAYLFKWSYRAFGVYAILTLLLNDKSQLCLPF